MDIHIRCTKCGKHLAVDEKTVGMIINCSDCSTALRVPINHEKQICPHCRGETLVANNMNGQSIECSSCHKTFSVKSPNDPKHHACPFCYTAILVPDDFKGQFIDCPTCNQRYMIHRPNLDFQYRQNSSDGSINGGQAEESPKGEFAKGIPQGLTANSLNRFRIWMLILAVILPIMAIGIYSFVPQSNHVVTIIAGVWVLSLSFINRKIRIVLPSIGLMWGIYRTDEGFTPYDITIIVASALIGIWSYRLPVIGPDGKKITLQEERWENEDRERQRRLEAERRAMQSNGHPLLWSLIIIIALLMVIPGFRHYVVSAFEFGAPESEKTMATASPQNKGSDAIQKQTKPADISRNEISRQPAAEIERRRAEREKIEQQALWKAQYAARAEKDKAEIEARRNEELQRHAEQQARIAAQNEQQQKAETRRLMRNVEIQRQRLRETLRSQGLDPRLADPENRDEMLRITRARAGQIRQPQANNIRPSGSPPSWQVREGRTRPDGVRTFNENQFIARHDGRYGGAFATAREASLRAEELNTQQSYNQEAVMEQAMYSGRDGVYMLNSRAGKWTYGYDANLNAFVVYQE